MTRIIAAVLALSSCTTGHRVQELNDRVSQACEQLGYASAADNFTCTIGAIHLIYRQ